MRPNWPTRFPNQDAPLACEPAKLSQAVHRLECFKEPPTYMALGVKVHFISRPCLPEQHKEGLKEEGRLEGGYRTARPTIGVVWRLGKGRKPASQQARNPEAGSRKPTNINTKLQWNLGRIAGCPTDRAQGRLSMDCTRVEVPEDQNTSRPRRRAPKLTPPTHHRSRPTPRTQSAASSAPPFAELR
ncbi:hypothetical protein BT67DRAFT_124721 [Trichocladium antarcticum]|uniref:Uncharacterized protein n=1 Tax=Trichocladium antarcticum TaxID=1450529 RepID=A0AAN6URJ1_9PEZI|nr:hypothetical protein BT67DRAFT_124721 [Trichocladium antarcticum]